ncbi:hypothetical protein GTV15_11870, partial [Streptomyces sp. SID7803]|nr:hypothetical protein [Streptomyces sp. SID7803]
MVFENYPVDRGGIQAALDGLRISVEHAEDTMHYPLGLVAALRGDRLQLRLQYRTDTVGAQEAQRIVDRL